MMFPLILDIQNVDSIALYLEPPESWQGLNMGGENSAAPGKNLTESSRGFWFLFNFQTQG